MWFVRMARWARRPPAAAQVKLVLVVLGLCLAVVGAEWLLGWPAWLTVNPALRR